MAETIPPDESMPRNRLLVAINFLNYRLRAWILNFNDPRHRFHEINSLWEGNSVVELILEALSPCEGTEDFRTVIVICCVRGKDTPIDQKISNMQTIWELLATWDEKLIPALNLFWDIGRLDSILGSYSIPGIDFLQITCQKMTQLSAYSTSKSI
jgi:hypothetical protein